MPGTSDYHDADRSNYGYDDVDSPNRGAQNMNLMTGDSSYAPSGVARDPTYGASYPANSSSPSGYDGRDYLSEAHLTGSTAANNSEHEQQHHTSLPLDSSYNGAPGEHETESPRRAGEYDDGYDLVEDKGDLTLLEETEPQPELDNYVEDVVQPGFDEAVLRALCDMDVGVPLLLDRIKQSMTSCREASVFLKKRAVLEDEYGRGLQKLARQSSEVYAMSDGKAGTFVGAWHSAMKIHEIIGENRIKFASRLNEMSEELNMLVKEVDKNRKGTKDLATRYERTLQESEAALEKIKTRHDSTADELQRFLLSKEGESSAAGMSTGSSGKGNKRLIGKTVAKGGMLLKGKNPANQQRQEEDIRSRMSSAAEGFRKAVQETQALRQEYFNFQLPRILRALKECADEIDLGLQYHLQRYAFLLESTALNDGSAITPGGIEDGPGIKVVIQSIDNQQDFRVYMQNYAVSHAPRGPRREGPWEEGFLPPLPNHSGANDRAYESQSSVISPTSGSGHRPQNSNSIPPAPTSPDRSSSDHYNTQSLASNVTPIPSRTSASDSRSRARGPTFGIYLADQMQRDGVEVPKIVEKCCTAIKNSGAFDSVGIYRLSGITSKIQKLKNALDRDIDAVDLSLPEWTSDINTITSVLKLWFRELPEPLLTHALYAGFIEAAKLENERLRHIRLHERVNDLPDPNYATLKYLMGHLYEVSERSNVNQMHVSNLAIVFGPTLLGPPAPNRNASISTHGNGSGEGNTTLQDMSLQCKAIETILDHYRDIFVDEAEE